ncbi:MAG: 3-oxoacyl-[acyl-carrier-protein] reductase [SAR116 cluster bacterium MED-G04]|jgi:3-oxoacyl-[acyl-carrier protein] reductase|nr:MAG: 3-oxoacyl-[acyl-carrier-protein] reductase [SAR116 cluster bacterium MED-G04]CAI8412721.1 MAG: 3-oxoacyl-[acyl-carrier-protein] reductase FabG [SAR116 cluster bacterium MED-G04]HCD50018.1 3-oxoacyl-[acyl-carrier-protein] reductase [Alphaproteobacteria bacterium]HCV63155.1 3-oxoacyl-[acyl-carrier-protein] reductase [Alphaproteobacteria bacterium]|tara:strand:- start:879 stop:1619 length:741 start_codon:yes stop_codon:yes gene_type:complete
MFDLTGKTALVTGASGGIGSCIARALHGQGAQVVLTGTRREALDELAASLGDGAFVMTANLSDAEEVAGIAAAATELAGAPIDILVNNAGITRDGLMMRMKDEDWDAVMDVNLKAAMILSRSVMRPMMKNRWGRIIQISSIVGYTGNPGQANYAAAKAGMAGFTKALAAEVASRGITANMIAPGFIRTPMTDALTDDQKTALLGNVPADRLGEAEEIAAAVVYLASPQSGYTTGATMHINGGMAML